MPLSVLEISEVREIIRKMLSCDIRLWLFSFYVYDIFVFGGASIACGLLSSVVIINAEV